MRFDAAPTGDGERITLLRSIKSRMPFGRESLEVVPFDDWLAAGPPGSAGAVARVLQVFGDGARAGDGAALAMAETASAVLHPSYAAALSELDAKALGLPPATRLSLDLRSSGLIHRPDFRIDVRWLRLGGMPAQAQVTGARIRHDGAEHRLPEPLYSTLAAVARVNEAGSEPERQEALAGLRSAMGDEAGRRVAADGVIERLHLAYASGFSLSLKVSERKFDFDPVLFGRERAAEAEDGANLDEEHDALLPPAQAADFAKRFRKGDGSRSAYLLDDGAILFVDPRLSRALAVVREAQGGTSEQRRLFARNPERAIARALRDEGEDASGAATLFIETQQFSERVSGIDIWRKPVLPWIKPKPDSWLPEKFGLRIGDPPHEQIVEIAPECLPEVTAAVASALQEERATFTYDDHEIPATQQTASALESLSAIFTETDDARDAAKDTLPEGLRQRYFLQISDNLDDVAYAPIGSSKPVPPRAPPELPQTIRSVPKPHQVNGFAWLVACWRSGMPGALLADDMGLGKTYQALAFLAYIRTTEPHPRPVLIVAPTGLLANWRTEIDRHLAPAALGSLVNASGASLARMRDAPGRDIDVGASQIDVEGWARAGVVLTTFETMRDYHLSFARQKFAAVIWDEAQKLKNPASQMTRAAKTLNARFQLAMTGTPVENRLQDLWSILDVVHPGLLGSSKAFETAYPAAAPDWLKTLHDLLTEPRGNLPAVLLRRMKDDCLPGLPAKRIERLPLPMPPRQAEAYQRVIARAMAVKGSGQRGRMLEILQHLRGVSLHPTAPEDAAGDASYFTDSARLATLFALLERIAAAREKVLIFCESLAMQALLAAEIRQRHRLPHPIARIHGGVTGDARQDAVDIFQARSDGFDVMILSPKAGGVGLTLTAANHVVHLSRWWNPAVEDQATDRVYRIGQTRDVTVYLPQSVHPDATIGPSSFDLKLDALMERKRSLSRGLLAPGDDDADAGALFDAVVGEVPEAATEADGTQTISAVDPTPSMVAGSPPASRPLLSARHSSPSALRAWPRRVVYAPNVTRDLAIFNEPVAGQRVASLQIVDPYACVDEQAREDVVAFVAMLARSAAALDSVTLTSWDADSVDLRVPESSAGQRYDLGLRWREKFGERPTLQHLQRSRRQTRALHDREVTATLGDGRRLIWDLGRGIDGVMQQRRDCRVTLTEG